MHCLKGLIGRSLGGAQRYPKHFVGQALPKALSGFSPIRLMGRVGFRICWVSLRSTQPTADRAQTQKILKNLFLKNPRRLAVERHFILLPIFLNSLATFLVRPFIQRLAIAFVFIVRHRKTTAGLHHFHG